MTDDTRKVVHYSTGTRAPALCGVRYYKGVAAWRLVTCEYCLDRLIEEAKSDLAYLTARRDAVKESQ